MQKKLLLSLVCTVPAALPALANVTLTVPKADAWSNPAIGGVSVTGTTVSCEVGVGSITQEVQNLPAGKYKISFEALTNVTWSVEGATVTVDKDDPKVGTFDLATQGDITIRVAAADVDNEFGFTGGQLTFVEDFSEKGKEFADALEKAYAGYVKLEGDASAELMADEKVITDEYKALNTLITKLGDRDNNAGQAVSVEDLISYYAEAKATSFADLFTKIEDRIAALQTKVEAFKPKAEASNEAYQIKKANEDNLKSLNGSIEWLLNNTTGSNDSSKGVNVLIDEINDENTNADVAKANLPGAEAALADINELKAAVQAAFESAELAKEEVFAGFRATIENIKKDLIEKWAKFENDKAAVGMVNKIVEIYNTLKPNNDYLTAVANIGAITDSEHYKGTDVFAAKKTDWLTKLQEIYNAMPVKPVTVKDDVETPNFELVNASFGEAGYTEKINEAKTKMSDLVIEAQNFAKEQNDAFDAGWALYGTEKTGWNAVMAGYKVNSAMPAELNAQYQALIDAANAAIDTFKTNLDTNYSKTALPYESYNEDVKAVEDAIDAIKTFLNSDYGTVTGLQTKLDAIKSANAVSFGELNGTEYPDYVVPTTKFDAQYIAIQNAIDKIIADMTAAEDLKPSEKAVSDTQKALATLETGSEAFFTAFKVTHDELIEALGNLDAFKTLIDKKYCAENGETFNSDDEDDYTTFRDEFEGTEGFRARYLAAAAAEGNASLVLAKALAEALEGKAEAIADATKTWNTTATQANLDFAKTQLDKLQSFMSAHQNELTTSVKFTEIETALGKVTVPADGDATNCKKADDDVTAQMTKMAALNTSVVNYLAVSDILDKIPAAETAADNANTEINGTAKAAFDHYAAEIDGYADTKDIVKAITEAFNAKDGVTNAISKAQADAAQQKLNSLNGMKAKMEANKTAYSNQINDSAITRAYVQAILDNVKKAEYQGVVADWIKQLEDLLNVRLIANDLETTKNYGEGNSVEADKDITPEYKAIRDAADEIAGQYTDGYDKAIIDQNNALNGEFSDWTVIDKKLNDGYLEAVNLYNFYKNELTPLAGYRAWMLDPKYKLVDNYASVYDVLPAIQSFNAQISALISQANAAKEYLPESEQYKTQYDKLVEEHKQELARLNSLYEDLTNDANAAAGEYYTAKVKEYNDGIESSTTKLVAAGLTQEEAKAGLKGIEDLLAEAEAFLNDDKQPLTYGQAMNTVARDKFAGIDFPAAITAAVDAKWAAEYELNYNGRPGKAATETEPAVEKVPSVAELRGTMADNGAVKAELDAFDAIVKKMEALNTKATTVDEKNPLIDNLKDYIEELEGYRADLEKMAATAVENQQYKDLYNGYMAGVGELQDLIDILNEYIAGYTLQGPVTVSPDPEVLLGELKAKIGDKPSAAIAGDAFKATVEEYTENIMAAIDAKKEAADAAGLATLKTWIDNTKVAYNTAVANGAAIADLTAEFETMQSVEANYAAMLADINGSGDHSLDHGFKGDFPALVTEQLETILETYKKLNPDGAASDLAAIQQNLADQKADIENAIDEAKKALDELVDEDDPDYDALVAAVHDALDPEFGALNTELDNLEEQWTAEGDKLLVNSYEYENAMEAVEGKISGISDKGADTLAAARKSLYNDQSAASLTEEWNQLNNFYTEVKTTITGYELDRMYGRQLGVIETMLTELKAAIDADDKAEALTKGLVLVNHEAEGGEEVAANYKTDKPYNGNAIQAAIENVAIEAAYTQTLYLQEEAEAALEATYEALAGKYFIGGAKLKADWSDLNEAYKKAFADFDANYSYHYPDPSGPVGEIDDPENPEDSFKLIYSKLPQYEAFMATFQSVIDGMQQINENAAGAEYTPGDVNRDGKVDIRDVMKLVDLVGNGWTYEELAENEETAWQAAAADLDGSNKLTINDISLDIDLMLGRKPILGENGDKNLFNPARKPAAIVNDANCTLAYLGEVDGNDRYAVVVANPTAFIAGQLDIKLPVGMTLVGVSATERTQGHEVMSFEHDAYTTRVLIFSMDNEAIAGNGGAVVYIDVQGHGSFSLDEVMFTDSEYHLHGFGNPGTSGIIDAIIDGAGAAREAIYDAAGRMYDRVQRGINIIRHSDGSVTKELRK